MNIQQQHVTFKRNKIKQLWGTGRESARCTLMYACMRLFRNIYMNAVCVYDTCVSNATPFEWWAGCAIMLNDFYDTHFIYVLRGVWLYFDVDYGSVNSIAADVKCFHYIPRLVAKMMANCCKSIYALKWVTRRPLIRHTRHNRNIGVTSSLLVLYLFIVCLTPELVRWHANSVTGIWICRSRFLWRGAQSATLLGNEIQQHGIVFR